MKKAPLFRAGPVCGCHTPGAWECNAEAPDDPSLARLLTAGETLDGERLGRDVLDALLKA
jgi:hypothetical protein